MTAVNPSTTNSTASSHGKVGSSSVLITGQGGPSGTGKIVKGESILPAPVFTQEVAAAAGNPYVLASITAKEEKEKANKKNSSNSGGESKQKATAPASSWAATIAATNASSALATNTNNTASGASASDNSDLSGSQNQGVNKTANATGSSSSGQVSPNQTSLTAPANSNSNSNSNSSSVAARDGLDTLVQAVAPIQHFQYNAYNGFGRNVIFPVPTSTFQLSVWYNIMVTATNDLSVNPFAMYASSIVTDFLELTLPPVDAIGAIASWPKPLSAYGCSSIPNIGGRMFQSDEANMQNIQQIMLEKSNLIDSHNNKNSVRSNKPSIQPLQQLFPGVKMHYGSGATN